jgi:exoribonuclease R
LLRQ